MTKGRLNLSLLIGPVGAGKTTFGRQHALKNGGVFFDLDAWMVRLFGADARPKENVVGWYMERRERCRNLLWDVTLELLRGEVNCTLELGLVTAADRQEFYDKATSEEIPLQIYLVDAPREIRRERVAKRNQNATAYTQIVPLEFFERASDLWQPPSDSERVMHGILDV